MMASYTYSTTDTQEVGVSDALAKYNAANPEAPLTDNAAYIAHVLDGAIASWVQAAGVHAVLSPEDKAAAAAILASVAEGGGDHAAAAADLLQRLQTLQS